jgi:YVTN family beta-propeller protein
VRYNGNTVNARWFARPVATSAVVAVLLLSSVLAAGGAHANATPAAGLGEVAGGPADILHSHRLVGAPIQAHPQSSAVSNPYWLAYSPYENAVYVAAPPSSVDIVYMNASPYLGANQTIPVGSDPFGVAVNPSNGLVYVTNSGSGNVSVLDGLDAAPIGSVPVGADPVGVAYDPVDNAVFVADSGSNEVTAFNATTGVVLATVGVGVAPVGVAVDTANGQVFVADSASSNITILDPSPIAVATSVAAGDLPYGVAFDNASGNVYVTDEGSSEVTVLAGATDLPVTTIAIPGEGLLQGIAYDYDANQLWIGAGTIDVAVIDPATETFSATMNEDPSGVAYDSATGDMCLTNTANRTFECVLTLTTFSSTVPVTFAETGLPAATPWGVSLDGVTALTTNQSSVTVYVPDGSGFTYEVSALGADYVPSPASGTMNITWAATRENVTFSAGPPTLDQAVFRETGLPAGEVWWVVFGGEALSSTQSPIRFNTTVGNYSYAPEGPAGFVGSPALGTIDLVVPQRNVSVAFLPSDASFLVYAYESGLGPGALWGIGFSTSTGENQVGSIQTSAYYGYLDFYAENGTYNYTAFGPAGYYAYNSTGTFTVDGGVVGLSVDFSTTPPPPPDYQIWFNESGLPFGTLWSLNFSGEMRQSNTTSPQGATIGFAAQNGTYPWWSYPTLAGTGATMYAPTQSSGSVSVAGANVYVFVAFQPEGPTWLVSFTESGLPSGTPWTVNLSSFVVTSISSALTFDEPNGTYAYFVYGVSGYTPSPDSGAFLLSGSAVGVSINYSASGGSGGGSYAVRFVETGLPSGTDWSVNLSGNWLASTGTTITFSEPNGTYGYEIPALPGYYDPESEEGSVGVAGGNVSVGVVFSTSPGNGSQYYRVTVLASGLPNGSEWGVTLAGMSRTTAASSLSFTLANGSYNYTVTSPSGYTTNDSGSLVVAGAPVTVTVGFLPFTYLLAVSEVGLPSGTAWSLTATADATGRETTVGSEGGAAQLHLANGSYTLSASVPLGYVAHLSETELTVAGAVPAPVSVVYDLPGAASPSGGGLSVWTWVAVAAGAVAALVGVALVHARRRPPVAWTVPGPSAGEISPPAR